MLINYLHCTYIETMLSPALVIVEMARNLADWPEAVVTAARPPSNAAIRFLNTSCRDRQVYKESSEVEKK